ncbi:MAG: sugar ABC transporter ATP-binding protein, partial [Mycobacterium sp.]|nr:sugar ABC transporter ATP-binding protein [Mycobacterium sp.]
APDLNAIENLYLGRETMMGRLRGMLGMIDDRSMRTATPGALGELSSRLPDLSTPVGALSGGQRQIIAIARATMWSPKLLLLDEPTAALGVEQTQRVEGVIRATADSGCAVLIISHDLPELLRFADRIVVMRLGQVVADWPADAVSADQLMAAMTGLGATEVARS